jgi:hypothetical protein
MFPDIASESACRLHRLRQLLPVVHHARKLPGVVEAAPTASVGTSADHIGQGEMGSDGLLGGDQLRHVEGGSVVSPGHKRKRAGCSEKDDETHDR